MTPAFYAPLWTRFGRASRNLAYTGLDTAIGIGLTTQFYALGHNSALSVGTTIALSLGTWGAYILERLVNCYRDYPNTPRHHLHATYPVSLGFLATGLVLIAATIIPPLSLWPIIIAYSLHLLLTTTKWRHYGRIKEPVTAAIYVGTIQIITSGYTSGITGLLYLVTLLNLWCHANDDKDLDTQANCPTAATQFSSLPTLITSLIGVIVIMGLWHQTLASYCLIGTAIITRLAPSTHTRELAFWFHGSAMLYLI